MLSSPDFRLVYTGTLGKANLNLPKVLLFSEIAKPCLMLLVKLWPWRADPAALLVLLQFSSNICFSYFYCFGDGN